MQAPIINYDALSKKVLAIEQKVKDGVNSEELNELRKEVDSLPDKITFEGLPDKPFDRTEAIDLSIVTNKGTVALKSGRKAYFQTDKTYTVDELIGAKVVYNNENSQMNLTVSRDIGNSYYAKVVDETPDGVTIKANDEYIFVAYTTNYTPSQANTPLPYIGVYFTEDSSGDYYIMSLSKEGTVTKRMDGNFVKMYKHSINMYTSGTPPYFGASLVFISPSSKHINTVKELRNSPGCWSNQYGGRLQLVDGTVQTSDYGTESEREIHDIWISQDNSYVRVTYINAYTTPLAFNTNTLTFESTTVIITDYVTEV